MKSFISGTKPLDLDSDQRFKEKIYLLWCCTLLCNKYMHECFMGFKYFFLLCGFYWYLIVSLIQDPEMTHTKKKELWNLLNRPNCSDKTVQSHRSDLTFWTLLKKFKHGFVRFSIHFLFVLFKTVGEDSSSWVSLWWNHPETSPIQWNGSPVYL